MIGHRVWNKHRGNLTGDLSFPDIKRTIIRWSYLGVYESHYFNPENPSTSLQVDINQDVHEQSKTIHDLR